MYIYIYPYGSKLHGYNWEYTLFSDKPIYIYILCILYIYIEAISDSSFSDDALKSAGGLSDEAQRRDDVHHQPLGYGDGERFFWGKSEKPW